MITFTQVGNDTPRAVEVVTDDRNGELVAMTDAFEEYDADLWQAAQNLAAARMEEGKVTFEIPGDEVGEVADLFEACDDRGVASLWEHMGKWNERTVAEAEAKAAES